MGTCAEQPDWFDQVEFFAGLRFPFKYKGLYPAIEAASRLSFSHRKSLIEMAGERDCTMCHGSRLEAEAVRDATAKHYVASVVSHAAVAIARRFCTG